jgi:hypothetical protein
VDARVEQGAQRAHLEFEIPRGVLVSRRDEDLDGLLLIDRIVAPPVRPPGVAVRAIEAHVKRHFIAAEAHPCLLRRGAAAVGERERREHRDVFPGGGRIPGDGNRGNAPAREIHGGNSSLR